MLGMSTINELPYNDLAVQVPPVISLNNRQEIFKEPYSSSYNFKNRCY